jgi:hypothetical protein
MNWINLRVEIIRKKEFADSSPVQRATWLNVLAYSCEQENSGRIVGAMKCSNRWWTQMCGVTKREVQAASPLLVADGDDVVVWEYPDGKQAEVQAKRGSGTRGGLASAQARAKQKTSELAALPSSSPSSSASSPASTEGNGRELGREGKGSDSATSREANRSLPAHLDTPAFRDYWATWNGFLEARNHGRSVPLQTLDAHLLAVASMTEPDAIAALRNSIAKNFSTPLAPFKNSSGSSAPGVVSIPEGAPPEAYTGGLKENVA